MTSQRSLGLAFNKQELEFSTCLSYLMVIA
jgi:hypothetical protein